MKGIKDENFYNYGRSRKNPIFRGGAWFTKNQYIGGELLKKGGELGQLADLRWEG